MDFSGYLDEIRSFYKTGVCSEHSNRPFGPKIHSACSLYDLSIGVVCSSSIKTEAKR